MVRVTHPLHPRLRDRSLCRPLCGFGGLANPPDSSGRGSRHPTWPTGALPGKDPGEGLPRQAERPVGRQRGVRLRDQSCVLGTWAASLSNGPGTLSHPLERVPPGSQLPQGRGKLLVTHPAPPPKHSTVRGRVRRVMGEGWGKEPEGGLARSPISSVATK